MQPLSGLDLFDDAACSLIQAQPDPKWWDKRCHWELYRANNKCVYRISLYHSPSEFIDRQTHWQTDNHHVRHDIKALFVNDRKHRYMQMAHGVV